MYILPIPMAQGSLQKYMYDIYKILKLNIKSFKGSTTLKL